MAQLQGDPANALPGSDNESERLLARAAESVAKGASSTMRVLDYHLPLVVERAEGASIWDADGNQLIDMNMGYGPLVFGHRAPVIIEAIERELHRRGTLLGFPDTLSYQVAELVKDAFPSIDLLRFTSTGTEAAQTAVRLARAFTGRLQIVLFEGHYHGSSDASFHGYHSAPDELDKMSGAAIPGTGGMNGAPSNAMVVPFNDVAALDDLFAAHGDDIAAVLLEPVMGNSGVIPPLPGYLPKVAEVARAHGSLVIFDEVMTGFRIARGGAQERFGVKADLTMLSKALSGGVPLGAIGGRADVLELLVDDTVFHGGVYSGNPMCLAAALAAQMEFERIGDDIFDRLERSAADLAQGVQRLLAESGVPSLVQRVGSMMSCWIPKIEGAEPPLAYREVGQQMDRLAYIRFQHAAQRSGVYFHPNHFEPWFISTAHVPAVIEEVLTRLRRALQTIDWTEAI